MVFSTLIFHAKTLKDKQPHYTQNQITKILSEVANKENR